MSDGVCARNLLEIVGVSEVLSGAMSAQLITTAEAAEMLGCSQKWVQALIKNGKIKAQLVGKMYLIRSKDLDHYEPEPPGRRWPTGHTKAKAPKRSPHRNGK